MKWVWIHFKDINNSSPSLFIAEAKHLAKRHARHWLRCVWWLVKINLSYFNCQTVISKWKQIDGSKMVYEWNDQNIHIVPYQLDSVLLNHPLLYMCKYGFCGYFAWKTRNNHRMNRFHSVFLSYGHRKLCMEYLKDDHLIQLTK